MVEYQSTEENQGKLPEDKKKRKGAVSLGSTNTDNNTDEVVDAGVGLSDIDYDANLKQRKTSKAQSAELAKQDLEKEEDRKKDIKAEAKRLKGEVEGIKQKHEEEGDKSVAWAQEQMRLRREDPAAYAADPKNKKRRKLALEILAEDQDNERKELALYNGAKSNIYGQMRAADNRTPIVASNELAELDRRTAIEKDDVLSLREADLARLGQAPEAPPMQSTDPSNNQMIAMMAMQGAALIAGASSGDTGIGAEAAVAVSTPFTEAMVAESKAIKAGNADLYKAYTKAYTDHQGNVRQYLQSTFAEYNKHGLKNISLAMEEIDKARAHKVVVAEQIMKEKAEKRKGLVESGVLSKDAEASQNDVDKNIIAWSKERVAQKQADTKILNDAINKDNMAEARKLAAKNTYALLQVKKYAARKAEADRKTNLIVTPWSKEAARKNGMIVRALGNIVDSPNANAANGKYVNSIEGNAVTSNILRDMKTFPIEKLRGTTSLRKQLRDYSSAIQSMITFGGKNRYTISGWKNVDQAIKIGNIIRGVYSSPRADLQGYEGSSQLTSEEAIERLSSSEGIDQAINEEIIKKLSKLGVEVKTGESYELENDLWVNRMAGVAGEADKLVIGTTDKTVDFKEKVVLFGIQNKAKLTATQVKDMTAMVKEFMREDGLDLSQEEAIEKAYNTIMGVSEAVGGA